MAHLRARISAFSRLCLGMVAVLCVGIAGLWPVAVRGQASAGEKADTTTGTVGRLVYFEGKVGVRTDGEWRPARIDQPLRPSDSLATGPSAKAEIKWGNGGQSTLGPADTQRVGHLYARAQARVPNEAASLLDRFRELFAEQTEAADDPAALRRGAGTAFEQATMLYRRGHFQKALPLFRQLLNRKTGRTPIEDSKAALARFALAHCYLDAGRRTEARSALQSLVETYPKSKPAELARGLLDVL